jgi:hypothetical protein
VTLVAHNGPNSDTAVMVNLIEVYAAPTVFIAPVNDTLFAIAQSAESYQWYFNGEMIAGATDSLYVPTQNGTYNVVVTSSHGCTATDDQIVTTIGIADVSANAFIDIYPNPLHEGKLTVVHSGLFNHGLLTITDVLGKIVLTQTLNSENAFVEVPEANGVYIVKLEAPDGTTIFCKLVRS